MALLPAHRRPLDLLVPGLLVFVLGTALIASTLAQSAAPGAGPALVNRTTEALEGLQDMAPPGAARMQP